jgi:hypothetical protein
VNLEDSIFVSVMLRGVVFVLLDLGTESECWPVLLSTQILTGLYNVETIRSISECCELDIWLFDFSYANR